VVDAADAGGAVGDGIRLARACSSTSRKVRKGESLATITSSGVEPSRPIGSRSFTRSNGSFLPAAALVVIEVEANSSVWPSAGALATASVPRVPPAPPLSSLRAQVEHARGSSARPMTDEELDAKFHAQAGMVLPAAKVERLLQLCRNVASLRDAGKEISAVWQG